MAISLNFKQEPFATSGIAMMQSAWTLTECIEQSTETGESQLSHLATFADAIGCGEADTILTAYKGSDGKTYFNLPAIMRDKEGVLVLSFGEQQIPVVFADKAHTVNGVKLTAEAIRDKDSNVTGVKFVLPVSMEFDGLDETVEFGIGVRTVPETDYKAVLKALKIGETPEVIKQMGTGVKLTLKPFMLNGCFKLLNYKEFIYKQPGKPDAYIYSGDSRNMETGEISPIELSTKPFKDNAAFKAVCSGKVPNKGIYFMVSGAFDLGENKTSALISALQLTETDGQVAPDLWAKFIEISKAHIASLRQANQGKILSEADIAKKREEMEAKQLAKMAAKKTEGAANSSVPMTVNTEAKESDFDEIPF